MSINELFRYLNNEHVPTKKKYWIELVRFNNVDDREILIVGVN